MDETVPWAAAHEMKAFIDDRSEAGLVAEGLFLKWRIEGETDWNEIPLAATAPPDTFAATLPAIPGGSTVEYWFEAADSSGRTEHLPRTAPSGWYSFEVEVAVSTPGAEVPPGGFRASAAPNPFRSETVIRPAPSRSGIRGPAVVYSVLGRRVRTLSGQRFSEEWIWNGRDDAGRDVPPGVYFVRLPGGGPQNVIRCVRVR